MAREERMRTIERNDESELEQKLLTRPTGIMTLKQNLLLSPVEEVFPGLTTENF